MYRSTLFSAIISKKSTKEGAIASAVVGPVAYLIFNYIVGINYWFSCLLAVVVSAVLMIGISFYINKKSPVSIGDVYLENR